ncbi:efflux transporter outer membrane subunit [Thauera sinica]|uniref:Efflux transporter outer membrane subunit n=1 Tax=Thauera sinica TaxID=2665146 RepID=A0ABW1AMX2_9RHOO|nr:efflux transporter outer membrane subunit [Thauera sp. K11]ATE61798.1 multidrug transporter [Thauera sp. K11]
MKTFPHGSRRGLRLAVCGASLALAGCSLAPIHERPAAPIPAQWEAAPPAAGSAAPASSAAVLDWQTFVTDKDLRELIDLALANNRDLRQTLLDVEAARAMYRVQRADRLPGLEVRGDGTRQRVPDDLAGTGEAQIQSRYQAGVGLAAFELDLFGRVRNLSEAALEEYLATEEAALGTRISLVAEVIHAYLARDGAQRRYRLTEQTLQSREASLRLTALRRSAGTATALDHQEALGLAEQARAELERITRELRQAGNALVLLTGVEDLRPYPAAQLAADTVLVQDIAAGTPSGLLAQRPDIRAAEHRLRARNASIGAARAAFFPRISLTGLFGSASAELSDLFEGGQRAWSFAPQITLPLFDGGRNRANLDLATLRKDIAVAAYEQTVQAAFREVADALAATDTLRREEAARRALANSSREALRLSEARWRAGVDSHLRYLDAQRNALANELSFIEVGTQRQVALATLFKTLGGGWPAGDAGHTLGEHARQDPGAGPD